MAGKAEKKDCKPRRRKLHDWEIDEARLVFGKSLNYKRLIVHECTDWTNAIDNVGRILKRMPPRANHIRNAITLGNELFFPIELPKKLIPQGESGDVYMPWLIHEMTHAWQFQHLGWRYLILALRAQTKEGKNAYKFGGAKGLKSRSQEGWNIDRFNLEQQGDITRSYYVALKTGKTLDAWNPFVRDIQKKKLK